ncbi:MAG: hypothetical protein AB7F59_03885 [Bdellovibrionales bacterium]
MKYFLYTVLSIFFVFGAHAQSVVAPNFEILSYAFQSESVKSALRNHSLQSVVITQSVEFTTWTFAIQIQSIPGAEIETQSCQTLIVVKAISGIAGMIIDPPKVLDSCE